MATKNLKILVIGDSKVGKTSLIQRFLNEDKPKVTFQVDKHVEDEEMLKADFFEKRLIIDDQELIVSIFDQSSSTLVPPRSFFKYAHGCCLVFSTVDVESLKKLEFWYDCLKNIYGDRSKSPPIVIAENKIDLIDKSVVNADEVERIAKQYKLRLYRTSAKYGDQVKEMFEYIASKASKFESRQTGCGPDVSHTELDQQARATRALSAISWTLPPPTSHDRPNSSQVTEPSKRRTGGVKPIFNKNKCPVM